MLLGIHSTKYELFLFWTLSICSSTSLVDILPRKLGHGESAVLLRAARGERCEARHEEVKARERDEVDRDLAQVAVQLAGEAQAAGHTAHGRAHQVVQVTIGGRGQLESTEADVVQG